MYSKSPFTQVDIQNEESLEQGEEVIASSNHPKVVDYSSKVNPQASLWGQNASPVDIEEYLLVDQTGFINFATKMNQIVVYNPTTFVVKLGRNKATTSDYEFIVGTNKVAVLPPMNVDKIYFYQDSFSAYGVKATLFIYKNGVLTPGTNAL